MQHSSKLHALGAFIKMMGMPFLIMCDWNMSLEALAQTGWVSEVGDIIVLPADVEATCTKRDGGMLDY